MRFSIFALTMLGLGASSALAGESGKRRINAQQVAARQNDLPPCEDGKPSDGASIIDFGGDCSDDCMMLVEQADNDNKMGVCYGECQTEMPMMIGQMAAMPYTRCEMKKENFDDPPE